jgi:hypothetical protein
MTGEEDHGGRVLCLTQRFGTKLPTFPSPLAPVAIPDWRGMVRRPMILVVPKMLTVGDIPGVVGMWVRIVIRHECWVVGREGGTRKHGIRQSHVLDRNSVDNCPVGTVAECQSSNFRESTCRRDCDTAGTESFC